MSEIVYSYRKDHKKNDFDKEKVSDAIKGITDVAKVAFENGYDHLLELEKMRIVKEHAEYIYPYICEGDEDITKLIYVFENVTGDKNTEIEILTDIIRKRSLQISNRIAEVQKLKEGNEKYHEENNALKEKLDSQQEVIKEINENMEAMLKELGMQKKIISKKRSINVLPYPYVFTSREENGIMNP